MKHLKRILAIALVALSLFAVALPALAGNIGEGLWVGENTYINATYVNIRSGPGTNYSIVATTAGTIQPYQGVIITGVSAPVSGYIWYQITGSFNGWIRGDYLYHA